MKKINLYIILFLIVAITGCNDDVNDNFALPQTNEQEELQNIEGFTTTLGSDMGAPLDFATLDETSKLEAVKITANPDLAETDTLGLRIEVSSTEDFKDYVSLPSVVKNSIAYVTAGDIQNIVKSIYGKAPYKRNLYIRSKIYICNEKTAVLANVQNTGKIEVTPKALFISTGYYIIGDMTNSWNPENIIKFNHSDADVYEDPIFTLVFTTTKDNQYWKIIPQSNVDAGNIWGSGEKGVLGVAVDGDVSLTGQFITTDAAKAAKIEKAGMYKMTLDMMEYTYTIVPIDFEEYIYVPGNHQSWTPATAPALQSPSFDGVYKGFAYLDGDFKFTKKRDWSSEYNYNDFLTLSAGLGLGGGSNINMKAPGFYQITVDVPKANLTTTLINSWGVIGDATVNGWDSDQNMTWNADKKCWTITTTMKNGTFKFRANDDWAINLGGKEDNLTIDGGNMDITAGTYYIELYVERTNSNNIYCTITKN